jgi:hypothetical protein
MLVPGPSARFSFRAGWRTDTSLPVAHASAGINYPDCGREPIPGPSYIHRLAVFVIAEEQRIEVLRTGRVPADDKLLLLVHPHRQPSTGTLSCFVAAIAAFRNDALQLMLPDGLDEVLQI